MQYLSECDILVFKGYAVQVFKLLITAVFIGKLSDKRNDILLGVGFEVACIVIVCISRVMERRRSARAWNSLSSMRGIARSAS